MTVKARLAPQALTVPVGQVGIGTPPTRGSEQLTVTATAILLSSGLTSGASRALLTLEQAQIRWLANGQAPTATVGHIMDIGGVLVLDSPSDIARFQAIRTGGTSGILQVSYG